MKTVFPFLLKYHRLVLSQTSSKKKYLEGHCYAEITANGKSNWVVWSDLLKNINANTKQLDSWLSFKNKCENDFLNLSNTTLKSMGFNHVHSEF